MLEVPQSLMSCHQHLHASPAIGTPLNRMSVQQVFHNAQQLICNIKRRLIACVVKRDQYLVG